MIYYCPQCGECSEQLSICSSCSTARIPERYELTRAEAKALLDELMPTWISSAQVKETLNKLYEFVK